MTSTHFFPMSLPMILSSGNKGDRWRLCCVDPSWSPSSSSNLSFGNPSRASDWNGGLQTFSWEHGGVRKTDDGDVSNDGVMQPVLMRLRSCSPGDSGVIKQLGSSGWLLFFLWFLSVCSMATFNYGRFASESKRTFASRSLLCVDDWRLVKTFWFNRQIGIQRVSQSQLHIFSRQNGILEGETAELVRPSLNLARPKASQNMKLRCFLLKCRRKIVINLCFCATKGTKRTNCWVYRRIIPEAISSYSLHFASFTYDLARTRHRVTPDRHEMTTIKHVKSLWNFVIGSWHDPIKWYGLYYADTQVTQWHFQNEGKDWKKFGENETEDRGIQDSEPVDFLWCALVRPWWLACNKWVNEVIAKLRPISTRPVS